MTAAQGLYAEGIAVTTTSSTTWVDVCSISAGSFTTGKKYLILANAFGLNNVSSGSPELRFRLVHGTTPTEFTDAYGAFDRNDPGQETNFGWVHMFTQPGTTELVKLQISASTTGTYKAVLGQIFALNLDDVGTEDTDYRWNEVTADYTTTSSFVAQATETFTPNGTDKWLVIAEGVITGDNATTSHLMRINDSVAGVLAGQSTEGEDATLDYKHYLLMSAYTPTNASHTISAEFSHVTNAVTVLSSRIFLLNLSKFAVAEYSYNAAEEQPAASTTWTTTRTLAPTPTVNGDWFVFGHYDHDLAATTNDTHTRLQINPTGGGLTSNPAYGDTSPGIDGWDATDVNPVNIFKMLTMNSGASRTINLDVTSITGTTQRVENRCLVAFSLELAGGSTVNFSATLAGTSSVVSAGKNAIPLTATLAGTSSVVSAGKNSIPFTSTLAGTSSLVSAGVRIVDVTATLAGTSSVVSAGKNSIPFTSTLAGTSSVASAGKNAIPLTATLAGTSSVASAGKNNIPITATLAGTSSVVSAGKNNIPITATLAGTSSLVGAGKNAIPLTATLAGTSSLVGVGQINGVVEFTATLAGSSSLVSAGKNAIPLTATLAGTSSVVSAGKNSIPFTATLAGTSSLVSVGQVTGAVEFTATLAGTSSVVSAGKNNIPITATLAGSSSLVSAGVRTMDLTAALAGTSSVVTSGVNAIPYTATLAGMSVLSVVGQITGAVDFTATLTGSSSLNGFGDVWNIPQSAGLIFPKRPRATLDSGAPLTGLASPRKPRSLYK